MKRGSAMSKRDQRTLTKKRSFVGDLYRFRYLYLLLLPAVVLTFIFSYMPMPGIVMAFEKFNIMKGFFKSPWVGWANFQKIFRMKNFAESIWRTLYYSIVTLIVTFPMPVILALLFNELRNVVFKKVVQTISYMPHFLSWASVIAIVYAFFATYGPFTDMMLKLFGESYERSNILMDAKNMLGLIIGTNIWKGLGWSTVVYMAAIAGIDQSMYEAAELDGANRFQRAIHITLPGILPTAIILLILSAGGILSANFEQVYGLQNLYTQEATEVINTLTYRQGLVNGNYSEATAFGLFQGVAAFALTIIVNKIAKRTADISLW